VGTEKWTGSQADMRWGPGAIGRPQRPPLLQLPPLAVRAQVRALSLLPAMEAATSLSAALLWVF
jgi:hypothetical protein